MTGTPATEAGIELHHVDPVPESHRRGRPRDLFHVWFASNLNVGNAIFGAIIYSACRNIPLALLAVMGIGSRLWRVREAPPQVCLV